MVEVLKDIDPVDIIEGYDLLIVGTNIYNRLSNGWQLDVKMKYPYVNAINMSTRYADQNKIGEYLKIKEQNDPYICLLYINKSYFRPDLKKEFIEYDALEKCLYRINIEFRGKRALCPIIGSSKFDGNGDKERIIDIFKKQCPDIDVTLCDYRQLGLRERRLDIVTKIAIAKEKAKVTKDKSEYYSLVSQRKTFDEKIKKSNKQ